MVDHLAAPRERVSMKAGNNRPFLWVREYETRRRDDDDDAGGARGRSSNLVSSQGGLEGLKRTSWSSRDIRRV
jgi:hypothetical protein